jgi:predicted dehydrogenase
MKRTTRRNFLKTSLAAGTALGLPRIVIGRQAAPSDTVRFAVVGMGATKAIGGVGGRGHQLIPRLREVPGAKIVALCDVDSTFLEREAKPFKDRGEEITTYSDLRRVFDNKSIDAVVVAMPNHWHALATVWACQAGKDVYVEKPFCYNLYEGQQMVAAAKKYGRMVQLGTQNRSSVLLKQTFEYLHGGEIGPIRFAHAIVYRPRDGIGKVTEPTPIPSTVDYNLWCGPTQMAPLMRKQLNYEWHWVWDTGNGELGNNGVHVIDICRWALRRTDLPPRAMSIGGRLGFDDCGQTANTQIAILDYQPAPIICEVRNVKSKTSAEGIGKFRGLTSGVVIDCEGGYFAGDGSGGGIFDKEGKKIKDIPSDGMIERLEVPHFTNLLASIRSRKSEDLVAGPKIGYASTAGCHLANISHRIGKETPPDAITDSIKGNVELSDAFERCRDYLRENGVNLGATPATLGPWLTYDAKHERFTGDFAHEANRLCHREYREPFSVPKLA